MKLILKQIAIISTLLLSLFFYGCIKEMARATGDIYKGVGGVVSDYGHGKYENKNDLSTTKGNSQNEVTPQNQTYFDKDTISFVQNKLNELDYNAGVVDGIYGPKTKNAIQKFQKKFDIPVSGVVDQITLNKLLDI